MNSHFHLAALAFRLWLKLIRYAVVKCLAQGLYLSALVLLLYSVRLSWRGAQLAAKSAKQEKTSPFIYTMQ